MTLSASLLFAEVPNRLTYQGRLARRGVSVVGNHIFVARIVDQDGKQLWSSGNITQKLPITGDFALVLEPTGIDWLNVRPLLEISIDGEKFTPNEPFAASPYANAAAIAATVANNGVGTAALQNGAVTNAKLAGDLALDASKVAVYTNPNNGQVTLLSNWRSTTDPTGISAAVVIGTVTTNSSQVTGTAVVCSPTVEQTIRPLNTFPALKLQGKESGTTNTLEIYDNAATPVLQSYFDKDGKFHTTSPGSFLGYKVGTFTSRGIALCLSLGRLSNNKDMEIPGTVSDLNGSMKPPCVFGGYWL